VVLKEGGEKTRGGKTLESTPEGSSGPCTKGSRGLASAKEGPGKRKREKSVDNPTPSGGGEDPMSPNNLQGEEEKGPHSFVAHFFQGEDSSMRGGNRQRGKESWTTNSLVGRGGPPVDDGPSTLQGKRLSSSPTF